MMLRPYRRFALLLFCLVVFILPAGAKQAKQTTPQDLESSFVEFKPVLPLQPTSLNLFDYEKTKSARSWPLLSPDRSKMVVSDIFYMPDNHQTQTRLELFFTGPQPALADMVGPLEQKQIEDAEAKCAKKGKSCPQSIDPNEINPQAFWNRYRPEMLGDSRQVILEQGFDRTKSYKFDVIQPLDWSADGDQVLFVYRPGILHEGIYKTIPILYTLDTGEVQQLTALPQRIWNLALAQMPDAKSKPVWDVQLVGWSASEPQAAVFKALYFENQPTFANQSLQIVVGYWRYNFQTEATDFLGQNISASEIARNGWIPYFKNPMVAGGKQTYAPGETLPPNPVAQQQEVEREQQDELQRKQQEDEQQQQPSTGGKKSLFQRLGKFIL